LRDADSAGSRPRTSLCTCAFSPSRGIDLHWTNSNHLAAGLSRAVMLGRGQWCCLTTSTCLDPNTSHSVTFVLLSVRALVIFVHNNMQAGAANLAQNSGPLVEPNRTPRKSGRTRVSRRVLGERQFAPTLHLWFYPASMPKSHPASMPTSYPASLPRPTLTSVLLLFCTSTASSSYFPSVSCHLGGEYGLFTIVCL
jgi:hypothetical protein